MIYIREYTNYKDIESICKKYNITDYTINSDGSIDVDRDVYLSDQNLKKLLSYFFLNHLIVVPLCPSVDPAWHPNLFG